MYDLLRKRQLALEKYQQVISANSESPNANLARKYLKQAYQEPKKS